MNTVKCRFCKKEIDKSTAYSVELGRYYCNEEHKQLQENKIKYKAPKTDKNGEPNDRRLLTDYIQKIFVDEGWDKHDINWTLITAQIKNIQKENPKLNCNWIRYCLWYLIEIKHQNLFNDEFNGSILNLVPFTYIEALNYYKETKRIKEELENYTEDVEKKVVCRTKAEKRKNWEEL